jgi:hypothetical protein
MFFIGSEGMSRPRLAHSARQSCFQRVSSTSLIRSASNRSATTNDCEKCRTLIEPCRLVSAAGSRSPQPQSGALERKLSERTPGPSRTARWRLWREGRRSCPDIGRLGFPTTCSSPSPGGMMIVLLQPPEFRDLARRASAARDGYLLTVAFHQAAVWLGRVTHEVTPSPDARFRTARFSSVLKSP